MMKIFVKVVFSIAYIIVLYYSYCEIAKAELNIIDNNLLFILFCIALTISLFRFFRGKK